MSKKIFLPLIISLFILSACGQAVTTNNPQTQTAKITPTKTVSQGILGSIKDAISKSLAFKCEYTSNNANTTVYFKNKQFRVDGAYSGKANTAAIVKDNTLWTWDTMKKEGITMTFDPTKVQQSSNSAAYNPDNIAAELEKQKQYCHTDVISDSMFTVPTDVKFTDLSKMMENLPNMQNKVTIPVISQIPSVTIPQVTGY